MIMFSFLRQLKIKSVKNVYNQCTKFLYYVSHQNNFETFITLYGKLGLTKISRNRPFSFKNLTRSCLAFVSVLCLEKKYSDNKEKNSDKRQDEQFGETLTKDILFMEAAKVGNFKDIKRLLKEGINVNQRHTYGWTALHVATINGHFRIVAELLSSGADPNLGDNFSDANDIAWEKQMKNEEVMAVRKEEFFPAMKMEGNCANFTALHYAVLIQDNDIVSLLLRSGADPTAVSETGFSPLDFAQTDKTRNLLKSYMKNDEEDIMKLHSYVQRLVRKGYSINITTEEEAGSNINAPVKLQIKKKQSDKLIKDVIIGVKLKNFVTV